MGQLQKITRRYTANMLDVFGPDRDIPALKEAQSEYAKLQ